MDVAVIGTPTGSKPPLLAIGEAKWNDTMGIAHVERLRHIRDLITQAGRYDTTSARLMCLSGTDFHDKAYAAAQTAPDIQLVNLETLYGTERPVP